MIVRSKRRDTYTKIDNEIFKNVNDLVAVGLLAYLLSLPDDWIVYKTTIYPKFSQGRGAVDKAFKTLKELGYLVGKNKRSEKGQMNGYEWIVYETPFDKGFNRNTDNRSTDNRTTENRKAENSAILTTNIIQTNNLLITNIEKVGVEKQEIFKCWISYRKEIKKEVKNETTFLSLIKRFNKESLDDIKIVVGASIENGWQGLFWDKLKNKNNGKSVIEVATDRSWNN